MSSSRHVIVIHRWRARYAEYERYIDHDQHTVTYITTEVGVDGVPDGAADVVIVSATDDLPAARRAVIRLAAKHGAPSRIVALKEDDLLVGADLRAEWNCPGPTRDDILPFRDKLIMSNRIAAAGIEVPAFAPAPNHAAVLDFAEHHGWPIVIKPRAESSSAGVVIAHRPTDIQMPANAMVQAFHPGRIYYVDGVFDGTRLDIWTASRYLQSCVDFRSGSVLGGVQEDDPEILDRVGAFAERALRALSNQPVVVHLELFVDGDRCAFLEVGARVGGGEIPFLWREVHGYDLMAAAFQIAIGQRPQPVLPFDRGGEITGELLAPAPARRPCRILEATPMVGRVPCLYAEDLLRPGDVLPNADAYYEHVGGRFRFRGPTSAAVEAAIEATAREFRVRAEPLPVAAAA